jgi:hypothetical protein
VLKVRPSAAPTIAHGYASFVRFFPGAREEISAIDEEVMRGPSARSRGQSTMFRDQYTSTGGQLYELMSGRDRFVADLRPLMDRAMKASGRALSICCHPYDLCTELIAREAGVVVVDPDGSALRAKLDVKPDVAWVGYANAAIRGQIEPHLQNALRRRGLFEASGSRDSINAIGTARDVAYQLWFNSRSCRHREFSAKARAASWLSGNRAKM